MRIFNHIYGAAVAVMVVCCLLLSSCEKEDAQQVSVSVTPDLLGAKTNMNAYVRVKCAGSWTLSLEYEDEGEFFCDECPLWKVNMCHQNHNLSQ